MTDEELRDLVAETSRVVAENSRAIREMREEFERRWEGSERRWEGSERRWEGSERRWEESQRQWKESREEILASRRETDRLITSLERRLGEIGNALGLYTESMFQPSLRTQALNQGLFLATVKDDVFELSTPDDFVPRPFGLRGLSPGS